MVRLKNFCTINSNVCPLSLHTKTTIFLLVSFYHRLCLLLLLFSYIVWCWWRQRNRVEQSKWDRTRRKKTITSNLDLFESFMHTTFWPVYIALYVGVRSKFLFFFISRSLAVFFFSVYFLRDKHEKQNHQKIFLYCCCCFSFFEQQYKKLGNWINM